MLQFSGYVLALLLSTLITGTLFLYTLRRQLTTGSREFGCLLAALTIWSLTAAFEGITVELKAKIFWTVLSYFGSQTVSVFFFLFVIRYTQVPFFPWRWGKPALFIFPALSIILAATNPWHGWLWPTITQTHHETIGAVIIFAHGPWFWVEIAYAYALIMVGLALLVRATLIFPHLFSVHNRLLLAVAVLPWMFSMLYAFGSGTPRTVDLTPVAFSALGALLALSIFRYDFLRLAPVSRQEILERLWEGVMLVDWRGRVIYTNEAFQHISRSTSKARGQPAEILLKEWPELVENLATFNTGSTSAQKDIPTQHTFRLKRQSAAEEARWYELSAQALFDNQGIFSGSLVTASDITVQKRVEDTLRASEAALRARETHARTRQHYLATLNDITKAALEASDLSMMAQALADRMGALLNADGCYITRWDEAMKRAIPLAAYGALRTHYPADTSNPDARTMTQSVLEAQHALVAEDIHHSPYIDPKVTVGYPTRSLLGLPLIAGGRQFGAALIGFNDPHTFTEEEVALGEQAAAQISLAMLKNYLLDEAREANRQAEDTNRQLQLAMVELDELATTDPLTGAYNRNKFDELIHYEMDQFERYGQPLSLIMIDVDHYKIVNDTFGHHTGDRVLVELVRIIRENIRKTDSLTRWGGEEFLILCPGIGLAQTAVMGAKLHELIACQTFPGTGILTVSMGVTTARPVDSLDQLLSRVDDAVYLAKNNGRNRVEIIE